MCSFSSKSSLFAETTDSVHRSPKVRVTGDSFTGRRYPVFIGVSLVFYVGGYTLRELSFSVTVVVLAPEVGVGVVGCFCDWDVFADSPNTPRVGPGVRGGLRALPPRQEREGAPTSGELVPDTGLGGWVTKRTVPTTSD